MSQCSFDGMPEVKWENNSPTPAVWKQFQGPRRSDEDDDVDPGSPKLPRARVMRKVPPIHLASLDYPLFEESKRAANKIIEALQKASNESENTQTQPVQLNLTIPEMDEEDEESDNERVEQDVPFRSLANSSLDVIFDQSGNGEDLAPTAKSTFSTLPVERNSPTSDPWTDDDIFTEEVLSQVDEELKLTPKKPQGQIIIKHEEMPRESSTPYNVKKCNKVDQGQHGKARSFLNFMVDSTTPPKPSPSKHKTCVLDKKQPEHKPDTCIRKSITLPSKRHCGNVVRNHSIEAFKEESKPVNLSIPLEVLEDFMLDDSFADLSNLKHAQAQTSRPSGASKANGDHRKTSFNGTVSEQLPPHSSTTVHNENTALRPSTRPLNDLVSSKCLPNKIRKTEYQPTNCSSSCLTADKLVNQIDFNNSFSSDDEEMLLEAVALTESQRSRAGKNADLTELGTLSSQTNYGSGSGASHVDMTERKNIASSSPVNHTGGNSNVEKTKIMNFASSRTKCTASEIERKKQIALSKRKFKMKQKLF